MGKSTGMVPGNRAVIADQIMLLFSRHYGIICNANLIICVRGKTLSQQAYNKRHRNVPCPLISVEIASNAYGIAISCFLLAADECNITPKSLY